MLLEARDLRLIDTVAEEGTLTRAADRLSVSQPALSRHLRDLEGRTRLALFRRTGRQMLLTPAGERLRLRARDVLTALDSAEAEVRMLRGQPRELLRLSTACYTSYHWLPRVLQRFTALHPTVEVRIAFEFTRRPVPALLDGLLDLALLTGARSDRRILVRPVFSDEHVALVPPHHPWAVKARLKPQDFAGERLLVVPPPEDTDVINEFLAPARVTPREVHSVALTEALVAMVEAGLGVGCAPRWSVGPELRRGQLVAVRLGRGLRREWAVATRRRGPRSAAVEAFVTLLSQYKPSD